MSQQLQPDSKSPKSFSPRLAITLQDPESTRTNGGSSRRSMTSPANPELRSGAYTPQTVKKADFIISRTKPQSRKPIALSSDSIPSSQRMNRIPQQRRICVQHVRFPVRLTDPNGSPWHAHCTSICCALPLEAFTNRCWHERPAFIAKSVAFSRGIKASLLCHSAHHHCNEAPIGMVELSGLVASSCRKYLTQVVVVSHFAILRCPTITEQRVEWAHMVVIPSVNA